ncbi:MAG: choice-of-anchor D domain-containing protein [Bacteroidota bacterium]
MKKITLITDFTKIFFTTRITQNFYQKKNKGTAQRWLSTLCLTAAFCLGFIGQANATVYYLNGSSAINTLGNWKTARDGTGTSPANFTTSGDVFIVQGTGATTNGVGTGASNLSATVGSTMTFGAGVKFEVEGGATFTQSSNVTLNATATFILNNGATFVQNSSNATSIVGGIESWNANSTVRITNSGIFALADITGGTYPNVIYQRNSNTSTAAFAAVAGNFELIMTAATFTTTSNMVIGGNFTMTSVGNVIAAGFTIDVNGNVSNATTINQPFSGTLLLSGTSQTLSKSSTGNYTTIQIASGTTVTLGSNVTATSFTNSGTLVCGAYDLTVSGISQCGGPPEINIQGNATNIVDGDTGYSVTNRTDFSSTNAGTGIIGVTYTYTIQNTGTGSLTLGAITLGDNVNYSSTAPLSTTVAALGSTTFTITFNPTTAGVKNSTFSIVTNDSDENPYNFAITGTGVAAPEMNIQGNSIIITNGDATPSATDWTDFGSTNTGVGVTRTYTVTNTGTAALTLGTITLGDTTNYSSTAPLSTSLAGGASTTFTVTFNPTTTGVKNTTFSIVTNDGDENPYNFSITGTGAVSAPEISIQGNGTIIVDGDPTPITGDWTDFGTTNTGVAVTRTFTVYNTGTAALTLGAITLGDNTNYSATAPLSTSIAGGANTTFTVTFNPTTTGTKSTTFSIVTNDSDENPYNFSITGIGGTPVPGMNIEGNAVIIADGDSSPDTADWTDFGSTNTGVGVTRTFTVYNTGSATLTLGAITIGSNATHYSVSALGSTSLAAGASTTFTVTFNPTSTGSKNSSISIVTNVTGKNPYNFNITGTGTTNAPEINIQGNSSNIADGASGTSTGNHTDFGSTNIATPITRTYTIQNTGTGTLTIGTITLGDTTNYSVTTLPAASVAASGTTTFVVTFNPTTGMVLPTTISIVTNDSNENPYNFAITGTGIGTPEMNLQGNSNNIADGSVAYLVTNRTDFGTTNVGTAVVYTYTIQNTGNGTLTLGTATLTNLTHYSCTLPPGSINPGATATFTITYNPTANGTHNASFSIVTNDGDENPYNFNITGAATTAPEIDILGNATSITDGNTSPVPTNWTDFGSADYISETITKTFTIKNVGNALLTLTSAALSGSGDFTISSGPAPGTTLAAGASTTLVIAFNPASLGIKNATITVISDDTNEATYDFAIQGYGILTFYDSDGDGIDDNLDIDDDNDGILDATEEANCNAANGSKSNYKFLNETFGTGGRTTINTTYAAETNYCYESGGVAPNTGTCPDLDDWSLNDGEYTVGPSAQIATWAAPLKWYAGDDHTPGDTNGRMAMFNAAPTPGIFYTANITGALPTLPITYSFWVLNLDRASHPDNPRTLPNITVEFRNATTNALITSYSTGGIPVCAATPSATDWHQFTNPVTLGVSAFKVVFINNAAGGSGNDLAIDDISITQSLCNYDNDAIADMFDLDSDNDGIPDVVEAGLGQYSNGKGKMDVGSVGADGLNTNAITASGLPTLNSDGDTLPNTLDLDSDNDSVFDIDEAGTGNSNAVAGYVNGDGDISGDGFGEGSDTEAFRSTDSDGNGTIEYTGDGILDLFDYGTGGTFAAQYGNSGQGTATATPATTYLKDTDSDGIPDYLDIMSNGSTYDIANNKLIYASIKNIDSDNNGIVGITGVNTDADTDGILDAFDTNTAVKGSPRDLYDNKLLLEFDGRNDYAQDVSVLAGSAGSLMAWIDLNSAFSAEGFIVGQDSFHLKVNSSRILQVICNGTTLSSPTALDMQRWYHVAATYSANNLNLYLNGALIASSATPTGTIADVSVLTIGRNPGTSTNFFKGKIDEVRVFNVRLTSDQLQRMVYQELGTNTNLIGTYITGKEIGQEITTSTPGVLTFTNMLRYYRMDTYKDDIIDDLTTTADDVTGTKIYNHKNIYLQQAPMPFVTIMDGDLATAVTDATKDIQGSDVNNYNTIVNVKHNNTTTVNRTDIGLFVDSGKSLTVNGDAGLTNNWWVKLDGKIDLVGMSQLVQTSTSDLDVTSAGYIERDQQGQTNKFNYNYWSSPVNPINITANNTNYTLAGILKDGTTTTPQNITWVGGYDGSPTSPISLARYWLYKFDSAADAYANWVQFTENTALRVGQGYTLKGSGAATATQNLTFVGKPNNGTINNTVGSGQLLLVGNPYPSAIDAYKFLDDNLSTVERSTIDGTLYFWQHASENNTHILANYLGSYGVLNRAGGVPPIVPTLISGQGSTAKVPNQYIPVGQGFFVYGTVAGGSVQFNNSQRAFIKENNAASNTLFRTKASTKSSKTNNNNDAVIVNPYKKIRLGYNTANGYHRQVLLAFMDDKATSGIDYGYDGEILDDFPNDMYLLNDEMQLVIEGESNFNADAIYPIGVKSDIDGKVSFIIDEIENFDSQQPIFIYDNLTDTYHDIRLDKVEIDLLSTSSTSLDNRFSLRFTNKTLGVDEKNIDENAIIISHIQKGNMLEIDNQLVDITIEKVTLLNMLGQTITSWEIENQEQQNILIPLKNVSSGIYITKIKTSKGDVSKKIIIK